MTSSTLFYATHFFSSIFSLMLGLYVLIKGIQIRTNQLWFAMCLFVAMWSASIPTSLFHNDYNIAILSNRFCNISAAFIPVFFSHFCLSLTGRKKPNNIVRFGYLNCLLILSFGFTRYFIPSMEPINVFNHYPVAGPIFVYFTIHFLSFMIYAEYVLYKAIQQSTDLKKVNQLKYVLIATTLGFLSGIIAFLPAYGINIYPHTMHFVWVYAAIITYAILKHNLMNISIVIRKGLIYSTLIGALTAIYFSIVFVVGQLLQSVLGFDSVLGVVVSITVIALCFKPLEHRIQTLLDQRIFHGSASILAAQNQQLMNEIEKQDKLRAISTLAAGMAHEIKNPLTSIKTFAEYLPKKYDDPEFREKFSQIIGSEIDKINRTVGQLLDFSKPQSLNCRPEDIHAVLDATLELISNQITAKGVTCTKHYADHLPQPSIDRNQIMQVFLNLFLNALDAVPRGGRITVSTQGSTNHKVSIHIQDNGRGITQSDLIRVFDPFFTTKTTGTGLGLSIAYGIVEKHGGKIKLARTEPGTCVVIEL